MEDRISSTSRGRPFKCRPLAILIILAFVFYLPLWVHIHLNLLLADISSPGSSGVIPSIQAFVHNAEEKQRGENANDGGGYDHDNRITAMINNDNNMDVVKTLHQLQDRVKYLETKLNSYLAFTSDPFLSSTATATCKQKKGIQELACRKGASASECAVDNQKVCLDDFPPAAKKGRGEQNSHSSCVVYDFGIRESPQFGLAFAKDPFDCDVVGFDPSPISVEWWKKNKQSTLSEYPKYRFLPVGAAGHDGNLTLREYDWGQVSIIHFPTRVVDKTNCNGYGQCKYAIHQDQKAFSIPVRTLKSIMTELKHDRVHLLKLDVEGSEYLFLERMIDNLSCRKVDQLTLEWHHYDYDVRYGVTSNPQINVLVALLKERCGLEQFWVHESKGWPSNQKSYADMNMQLYYTLSSFRRTRFHFDSE